MKCALKWLVVLMMATTLVAQTATTTTKKSTRKIATKAAEQAAVTAEDVQALKDALAAQQKQIQQLQQALEQTNQNLQSSQQQLQQAQSTASDAQQKAASVAAADTEQKDTVAKLSNDMADVKTTLTNTAVNTQDEQKRFSSLEGALGRFRWNGDIRVRGESFFQPGEAGAAGTDRERARLRVRFGFEGKMTEDFVGGLSIATGALGDPTSTNTTLTNDFEKKTIGLDKAYIIFQPHDAKWVTVTAGKFAYTWQRTNNTFDPDLNPEGFAAKFAYNTHGGAVKSVSFQPMLLYFNEVSAGTDSYAVGGQVASSLQIGRWSATPSLSLIKWNTPDALLGASAFGVGATTTTGGLPVPGEGPGCAKGLNFPSVAPCAFGPNGFTNASYVDAAGKPHFWSQWFYADFILNNTIKTGWSRMPVNLVLEYEDNLDAKDHPLAATGNLNEITSLGKQSHLYMADFSVGQTKNKNDFQVGYSFWRNEQDAVLAAFDESDQRAPTNDVQNKFYVNWKLRNNTVAGYTLWVGHTLNTNLENAVRGAGVAVGGVDPSLKRMQFDLIYTF